MEWIKIKCYIISLTEEDEYRNHASNENWAIMMYLKSSFMNIGLDYNKDKNIPYVIAD
jgi:hypothetical protein